ncbi:hypothetical protein J6590_095113 [Homalodisca vitripennis]|nr:hypothetical protein J6590_095113 [Homalodisca vitripennis]
MTTKLVSTADNHTWLRHAHFRMAATIQQIIPHSAHKRSQQGAGWGCDSGNKTRKKSMRLEYAAEGLTLETVMNTLKEMLEEQKTNTAYFYRYYEILYSKVEENTGLLFSELVKHVGKALYVNINNRMIGPCHRTSKKPRRETRLRGIIIKFVRWNDKEELMRKRREKKIDFSTRHLGLTTDIPIYLNNSLSPARKRLLAQARQLRKERGHRYIWLRNGNILLRKEEKAPVVKIRTQADLNGL